MHKKLIENDKSLGTHYFRNSFKMNTHLLTAAYNELIESREYAIYLIRLCLARQFNIIEPPNVYEWEYKTRQVLLTSEDCEKIKESSVYKCKTNETNNAGTIYAKNFLSVLEYTCNTIKPSIDWMYYVYLFLGLILLLGFCFILKLFVCQMQNKKPTTRANVQRNKHPLPSHYTLQDKTQLPYRTMLKQSSITEEKETQCDCGSH